jgi:1,4-alpha-glucan branching enzyme
MPRKNKDRAVAEPVGGQAESIETQADTTIDSGAVDGESLMRDVVFTLPAHAGAGGVVLVGDFNGWSQASHPMTRSGDGFHVTVPLEKDRSYRYRFLIDGHRWENDWNADQYVPNEFGGDDSVRAV